MKGSEGDFVKSLIAANIKRLRDERDWNQDDLADKAKTNFQYISAIEREARGCGHVMRKRIAAAFGVPQSELIKMPPGMAPKELEEMWNLFCKLYDAGMQEPLTKIAKAIEAAANGEVSLDMIKLLENQADMIYQHYYTISNAADMDARRAVDNNPVYAGMMEASAKRKQQQKIDAAMELRKRGIQP